MDHLKQRRIAEREAKKSKANWLCSASKKNRVNSQSPASTQILTQEIPPPPFPFDLPIPLPQARTLFLCVLTRSSSAQQRFVCGQHCNLTDGFSFKCTWNKIRTFSHAFQGNQPITEADSLLDDVLGQVFFLFLVATCS